MKTKQVESFRENLKFYNKLLVIPTGTILFFVMFIFSGYPYDFNPDSNVVIQSSWTHETLLILSIVYVLLIGMLEACTVLSAIALTCMSKYGLSMYSSMKIFLQAVRHMPKISNKLNSIQRTYDKSKETKNNTLENHELRLDRMEKELHDKSIEWEHDKIELKKERDYWKKKYEEIQTENIDKNLIKDKDYNES